jgi:PAS domain-containing protein
VDPLQLLPVRDGFIGIHRDVSERGRALQELRDSQQQVREGRRTERILESITDAFYLLDDGWRFACVNERAVHVLGGLLGRRMTRDDFLAQRVWDLFPAILATDTEFNFRAAMRQRRAIAYDYLYPATRTWGVRHGVIALR